MNLGELKNQSFPRNYFGQWEKKAEESLKGKSVKSLTTTTYENIKLKPLYCGEDEKPAAAFPGGSDFRRGIYPLGYITNRWQIAQRISYQTIEELTEKLQHAFTRGQTAISFEISSGLLENSEFLEKLVKDYSSKHPFAINARSELQKEMVNLLAKITENQSDVLVVTGYIGSDPLSSFVIDGILPKNDVLYFADWVKSIKFANDNFPSLQTVLINTSPYHNGGANAVQELGIAAATGVFYLQQLLAGNFTLEQALAKMIFQFSIGANFFMEIAKLRAARILWDKITEVYGADMEWRGMQIAAETSAFTKTTYDKHVNILRAGNEAFAAIIGGIQYLHVSAFDEIIASSYFSERIAGNTQLILQDEVLLEKVIDPAGGSWYVEELTRELAEKAWEFFQEIEANGGILNVVKTSWLQREVAVVNEKRQLDIFTREKSIIGTNVYANLEEEGFTGKKRSDRLFSSNRQKGQHPIQPIPQLRLAEPYETLRNKAVGLKEKIGTQPMVGMICLGILKHHKAKVDFIKGFLAVGGIYGAASDPVISSESGIEFVKNSHLQHFCLCGSNDQYEEIGHEVLLALKAEFPESVFYLAGLPEKERQNQWFAEGIRQFIHVKSNCYEILSTILTDLEVTVDE
ncbi:methylmalonyl-CoA mutase subunit beta [Neobacillus ginsengisoli]|uniref:Methylmalonyl-CoA mutase n=1 Tax=Neobacillus ginsengisoli TaxID=904295 RepID=A0ABT9XPT0_9BACI|nr:methylmalonyl-CoA mutase subunit beta [Neobacillus ginsengisoli]MDQ0197386.1 methylmalonyl-CoA mutase [Neobacillus ginsengisoli]